MHQPARETAYQSSALPVQRTLLDLHEALAKYNAAIRVRFPPSHPLTRAVERNTSGWINDAPYAIQEFKLAAEDALFREQAREYYLGDGVADLIDGARVWAGSTPITERGKEIWTKRVTIVERALFDLVRTRADRYFGAVWQLNLIDARGLVPAQQKFDRKLNATQKTLTEKEKLVKDLETKIPGMLADLKKNLEADEVKKRMNRDLKESESD